MNEGARILWYGISGFQACLFAAISGVCWLKCFGAKVIVDDRREAISDSP